MKEKDLQGNLKKLKHLFILLRVVGKHYAEADLKGDNNSFNSPKNSNDYQELDAKFLSAVIKLFPILASYAVTSFVRPKNIQNWFPQLENKCIFGISHPT